MTAYSLSSELNENQTNEDELAAERKQTLNVVQSVLNINLSNPTSKGSVAVKKFKYGLCSAPFVIVSLCHKCLWNLI